MDTHTPSTRSDLREMLREHWRRLDENDLDRIERERSALAGILQQRYGLTREAAEQQAVAFLHAHHLATRHAVDAPPTDGEAMD